MARHFGKLAVALAALFIGGQALAHGHHSHGKPLTEVEKKRRRRAYSTIKTSKIATADWEGVWQSVYPYLLNGELDPVFKKKAAQDKSKTFAEVKAYYRKGYATDVDTIGIENGVMEFHRGDQSSACQYKYAGHKILTYVSGKKGVRYSFECRCRQPGRRNSCSSAITLSVRASRRTSISLWATHRKRRC